MPFTELRLSEYINHRRIFNDMYDNEMPTDEEIRVMTENYVNALVEYKRTKKQNQK